MKVNSDGSLNKQVPQLCFQRPSMTSCARKRLAKMSWGNHKEAQPLVGGWSPPVNMELLQSIQHKVVMAMGFLAVICLYLVGNILAFMPYGKVVLTKIFHYVSNTQLPTDVFWGTFLTPHMMRALLRMLYLNSKSKLRVGKRFPDARVANTKSQEITQLSKVIQPGRPLVLNFGSCSWPPFMAKLPKFLGISKKFSDVADFAIIYIEEAHAEDEWSFEVSSKFLFVICVGATGPFRLTSWSCALNLIITAPMLSWFQEDHQI